MTGSIDPGAGRFASPSPDGGDIPRFGRRFLEGDEAFTRIGRGEIGGKGAGLELIRSRILPRLDPEAYPGIEVDVPVTTVLTTSVFDAFLSHDDLRAMADSGATDDRIAHAFQRAPIPAMVVGDLRALVNEVRQPLAIRSSSLLEDALDHPFAGVYGTKMVPNGDPNVDTRFRRLVEAIKFVYASTYFKEATDYVAAIGEPVGSERMAVVIQEVVGRRHGPRFYPAVSAVARSYSYYPIGRSRPEDGVVDLALGLGRQIVDGGLTWSVAPPYPKAPPPFNSIGDLLKNTQTEFWSVRMDAPPVHDPIRETEFLVKGNLRQAEYDGSLTYLASTYDPRSDQLRPGLMRGRSPRALTFAPLLSGSRVPFMAAVQDLLHVATDETGAPVEIELAMDLDPSSGVPARLSVLQVRPMRVSYDAVELAPEEMDGPDVVLASTQVLGNARRDDVRDVVYVRPETFDPRDTRRIAMDLAEINAGLVTTDTPYVLIGFGRWGSSDPWLGVPVAWSDISGARVVVEATLPNMNPDLSQGSHFFHNLISFRVLYLSVTQAQRPGIDWPWLAGLPTVAETERVRHVRAEAPLDIRVDGRGGRGVVRRGTPA